MSLATTQPDYLKQLSGANSLPNEILARVFTIHNEIQDPFNALTEHVFGNILGVCRRWRNISLDNPRIWRHVDVTLDERPQQFQREKIEQPQMVISNRLARQFAWARGTALGANEHSVDLVIDLNDSPVYERRMAYFLSDHIPPLQSYWESLRGSSLFLEMLPRLKEHHYQDLSRLKIAMKKNGYGAPPKRLIQNYYTFPNLELLFLRIEPDRYPYPFLERLTVNNLISLVLIYGNTYPYWYDNLGKIIARMPSLRYLTIEWCSNAEYFAFEEEEIEALRGSEDLIHPGITSFVTSAKMWFPRSLMPFLPNLTILGICTFWPTYDENAFDGIEETNRIETLRIYNIENDYSGADLERHRIITRKLLSELLDLKLLEFIHITTSLDDTTRWTYPHGYAVKLNYHLTPEFIEVFLEILQTFGDDAATTTCPLLRGIVIRNISVRRRTIELLHGVLRVRSASDQSIVRVTLENCKLEDDSSYPARTSTLSDLAEASLDEFYNNILANIS